MTIRLGRVSDAPHMARLTTPLGYDFDAAAAAERLARILTRQEQPFLVADREQRRRGIGRDFARSCRASIDSV